MSPQLTSQEALRLTATFAFTADRMRTADNALEIRAQICETASRIAFLRAPPYLPEGGDISSAGRDIPARYFCRRLKIIQPL